MTQDDQPQTAPYGDEIFTASTGSEYDRLVGLAAGCDPDTTALLQTLGLPENARCVELGAGTGSMSTWLADTFPAVSVTATDRDPRFLERLDDPRITVRRHDILEDDFPPQSFDLIFARNLLCHLPRREQALSRMTSWTAPGGIVLIEDTCLSFALGTPDPVFRRAVDAVAKVLAATIGSDLTGWARAFPEPLHRHGLEAVGSRMACPPLLGGTPVAHAWTTSLEQLRTPITSQGLLTEAELTEAVGRLEDPAFVDYGQALIAAWGRVPD